MTHEAELLVRAAAEIRRLRDGMELLGEISRTLPKDAASDELKKHFVTESGDIRWTALSEFTNLMLDDIAQPRALSAAHEVVNAALAESDERVGVLKQIDDLLSSPAPSSDGSEYVDSRRFPVGTRVQVHPDGCTADQKDEIPSSNRAFHGDLAGVISTGRCRPAPGWVLLDKDDMWCHGGEVKALPQPVSTAPIGARVRVVACGVTGAAHQGLEGTVERDPRNSGHKYVRVENEFGLLHKCTGGRNNDVIVVALPLEEAR